MKNFFYILIGLFLGTALIASADTPGGFTVIQGGTGNTAYGQGWLNYSGTGLRFNASTSPTVNYLTATSTTATSTFAYGIALSGGCFSIAGVCVGGSSIATPVTVANGGTGVQTFGQGWLFSSGGTGALAASTSPTINYLTATSTTATNTFAGQISVGGSYSIFGNTTSAGSASPYILSLGGTYSTTCGANLKLKMYEDTGGASGHYGYGICAGNMFGEVPTSAVFTWDVNGAEKMRLDTNGNLGIGKSPALPLDVGIKDANNNSAEFIGGVGVGTAPQTQNGYELYVKAIGSNADFGFESNSHVDDFFLNTSGVFGIFDGAGNKEALTATTLQLGSDHAFSFSSTGDALVAADTGISRISADVLGVGNGSQGDTTGTLLAAKAGISSTTPWATLSVASTTQGPGTLPVFAVGSTSNASLFTVLGNGQVAIGSTSPLAVLSINTNNALPAEVIGTSTNNKILRETLNNGQVFYGGPTDTVAIGAGAGGSASVSITSGVPGIGEVSLTAGSLGTPTADTTLFTITIDRPAPTQCQAFFQPTNDAAAALSGTNLPKAFHTSTHYGLSSNSVAITGAATYTWSYYAICY